MPKLSSLPSTSVWMVRNGEALVKAILQDKKYGGPASDPILQRMLVESTGDLQTAKSILKDRMMAIAGPQGLKLLPFLKDGRVLDEDEVIDTSTEIDIDNASSKL